MCDFSMEKTDITIIVTHYNQNVFLKNCLKSIFNQKGIFYQLILVDDKSTVFDKNDIETYIKNNCKENLVEYSIVENKFNIGTTRSLNNILDKIKSDYCIFIAADDELNNAECLKNNINYIKNKNIDILITQQLMYDHNMKELFYKYVEEQYIKIIKTFDNKRILNLLSRGCFFPSGATIYKSEYIKNEKFDIYCKLIEDWPTYLKACLKNAQIDYFDQITLNHRDGGISHSEETSEAHVDFIHDIYVINCKYLIPNLNKLKFLNKIWVVRTFKYYKDRFKAESFISNIQYKYISLLLILWYSFIRIKNFVDTQFFVNITLLLYIINTIVGENNIYHIIFKYYIIISAFLMASNILYRIYETTNKKRINIRR